MTATLTRTPAVDTHTDLALGIELARIQEFSSDGTLMRVTTRAVDLDSGNLIMSKTFEQPGANVLSAALFLQWRDSLDKVPPGTWAPVA
jgi:hypothetical protein